MRKILSMLLICVMGVTSIPGRVYAAEPLEISAPHAVLMELTTGDTIYSKDQDTPISPASITKIMTLLLIFEEIEKGKLSLDDTVTTSAYAKSMGGSQVFLEEGETQNVETMIKCIVIASGNDASVAMAEHISGSEEAFVQRMNERAESLGMKHTHFMDCCGLTDSKEHYSSAYDVALMSRELVSRFPKVLEYSSVWMEEITHVTKKGSSPFTLTNTNKLIRGFEGCVGLKTGSTSLAKYCVSAVAKRNGITLIAVVMTAPDYKVRFRDAAAMLGYGFGVCSLYVDENKDPLPTLPVKGALKNTLTCQYEKPFQYLDTDGKTIQQVKKKRILPDSIQAPVKKGERVGEVRYYLDGKQIGTISIQAKETILRGSYLDFLLRILRQSLRVI